MEWIENRFFRAAGVQLSEPYTIGSFVVLGETPRECVEGELPLSIASGAIIRSHTVIYAGNTIGSNFQSGHRVIIRERNTIGADVSIGSGSIVEHHVRIGNRVRLHCSVFVPEFSVLEDDVWIGPNAVLTNAQYPNGSDTKEKLKGPLLRQGCIIGANCTILPGVEIGKRALVGAGSVVTKNIPEGMVVAGNPARILRGVDEIECYRKVSLQEVF